MSTGEQEYYGEIPSFPGTSHIDDQETINEWVKALTGLGLILERAPHFPSGSSISGDLEVFEDSILIFSSDELDYLNHDDPDFITYFHCFLKGDRYIILDSTNLSDHLSARLEQSGLYEKTWFEGYESIKKYLEGPIEEFEEEFDGFSPEDEG